VGKKKNKIGRIYAYHRESGEIVVSNHRFAVWGKRDKKTAQKPKNRIKQVGKSNDRIGTDKGESFLSVYGEDKQEVGKEHRVGREGKYSRLRYRIWRVFLKTCSFTKKLFNYRKAFDMAFFYINYGFSFKV
jgi:IS1 family transposase